MYKFNKAATLNFVPKTDIDKHISAKIFTSKKEMEDFFLTNVDYMMKDQSNAVTKKNFFHAFNYIHPIV